MTQSHVDDVKGGLEEEEDLYLDVLPPPKEHIITRTIIPYNPELSNWTPLNKPLYQGLPGRSKNHQKSTLQQEQGKYSLYFPRGNHL
ncbi:hypothetical protein N7493_006942 [Penicillium malachiteum]|uniref:Uncharacterized protein n=1 Tax=Penicillium malachiteum TaxID=1324776 RepID=A0AAD6HJY2_9EURO|nr:hypothetical protein N7493_006942 [Penicillium malachiteum]